VYPVHEELKLKEADLKRKVSKNYKKVLTKQGQPLPSSLRAKTNLSKQPKESIQKCWQNRDNRYPVH